MNQEPRSRPIRRLLLHAWKADDSAAVRDPVCGMSVDRASAKHFARHQGQGFYFCSAGCEGKFEAEPATYLGDRPAPEPMRPDANVRICPAEATTRGRNSETRAQPAK